MPIFHMNREVEKGRALEDGEARQVVQSLVKQRRDSIEQFLKGGRQDLVDKETAEITVLESYLPPAADPALVDRAVAEAIAETGATSPKDMIPFGRAQVVREGAARGAGAPGKSDVLVVTWGVSTKTMRLQRCQGPKC